MENEFVVIENNGTGEILVMPVDVEYDFPNLVVHRGNTCEHDGGFSEAEARQLAEELHATGVRGTYHRP